MKKRNLLTILTSLFFALSIYNATACDRASLQLNNVVDLGNNQYQIDMIFCTGAGQNGTHRGADQNTGTFSFWLSGGATVVDFPDTLYSPQTAEPYHAIPYYGDSVLFYHSEIWWWACISGEYWGYSCGDVQTVCKDISIITNGLPTEIQLLGMEGGGNAEVSCQDADMTVFPPSFTTPGPCVTNNLSAVASADRSTIHLGYDSDVCVNLSVAITGGSGDYLYSWDTPITHCPQQTTTYTVSVEDRICGFQTTASVTVEVEDVRCGKRNNKVVVCHNNRTKCVGKSKARQLLNQGATLGACVSSRQAISNQSNTVSASLEVATFTVGPNPVQEVASIQFTTPVVTTMTLNLFDLNGRLVKRLYNGQVEANQTNTIDFHKEELNAGLYLLQLKDATGTSMTKKLIIQ